MPRFSSYYSNDLSSNPDAYSDFLANKWPLLTNLYTAYEIASSSKKLSDDDVKFLADYLFCLKAIAEQVEKPNVALNLQSQSQNKLNLTDAVDFIKANYQNLHRIADSLSTAEDNNARSAGVVLKNIAKKLESDPTIKYSQREQPKSNGFFSTIKKPKPEQLKLNESLHELHYKRNQEMQKFLGEFIVDPELKTLPTFFTPYSLKHDKVVKGIIENATIIRDAIMDRKFIELKVDEAIKYLQENISKIHPGAYSQPESLAARTERIAQLYVWRINLSRYEHNSPVPERMVENTNSAERKNEDQAVTRFKRK